MAAVLNFKKFFNREESAPSKNFRHSHSLNSLNQKALEDLLQFMEQRFFCDLLPEIKGKKTALIAYPHSKIILEKIVKLNPEALAVYQPEPFSLLPDLECSPIQGSLKPLSLRPDFFDALLIP